MSDRPTVSVIVPFAGSTRELEQVHTNLLSLVQRPGDQLIVADNRRADEQRVAEGADFGPFQCDTPPSGAIGSVPVQICRAQGVRAPGFARNWGTRIASGEWLVFLDADTVPDRSLLEDYFVPMPRPSTAVLAGAIIDRADRPALAARHSVARGQMSQLATMRRPGTPYAQTASCAVRRSAFLAVGGFEEDIRAGEDADLCFRLQRAGWEIEERPSASVEHRCRETLWTLLGQLAQHGSGAGWLNRRYPGEFPPPDGWALAARLLRSAREATVALARGDREDAALAALDLVTTTAFDLGRLLPNRARRASTSPH